MIFPRVIGIDADRQRIAAAMVYGDGRLFWKIRCMDRFCTMQSGYSKALRTLMRVALSCATIHEQPDA